MHRHRGTSPKKKIEGNFRNYQEITVNMGQKLLFLGYVSPKKKTAPELSQADRLAQGLVSS